MENYRSLPYYITQLVFESFNLMLYLSIFCMTVALVISRKTIASFVYHICCNFDGALKPSKGRREGKKKGPKKKRPDSLFLSLFVVLLVFFSLIRIASSVTYIARCVVVIMDEINSDSTALVIWLEAFGTSLIYFGFGIFLVIYCALVYLWFEVVVVYTGKPRAVWLRVGRIVFFFLGLVGMLLSIPLITVEFVGISREATGRTVFLVMAPIGVIWYSVITLVAVLIGLIVVRATHDLSHLDNRNLAVFKMVITLALTVVANLLRVSSVVSGLLDRSSLVSAILMTLLFRGLPDLLCIVCIIFLLSPYKLHCCVPSHSVVAKLMEPTDFHDAAAADHNSDLDSTEESTPRSEAPPSVLAPNPPQISDKSNAPEVTITTQEVSKVSSTAVEASEMPVSVSEGLEVQKTPEVVPETTVLATNHNSDAHVLTSETSVPNTTTITALESSPSQETETPSVNV